MYMKHADLSERPRLGLSLGLSCKLNTPREF